MRRGLIAVAALLIWLYSMLTIAMGAAKADVGGEQTSPGQCPYPAVGPFGFDGVAQHYACDFPTEINGSHHRCVFGGVATTITAGVSLLIFNAGIQQPVGVLEGACYWACPDGQMAEEPNPVMTWQGSSSSTTPVKRSACKPIGPNPFASRAPGQPEPPPPADQGPPPGGPTPGQQDTGPAAPAQLVP